VHSPAGAQGMNTGIQDGWSLGWKLALVSRSLTNEALLDSYNAEPRQIGRFLVRFTDRTFSVATSTNSLVRAIRTPASDLGNLALVAARRCDSCSRPGMRS
jgi:2-polyprenyl-6-methoxyphenol hydroxylase-like FAD-dependent oxidoreductase